MSDGKLKNEHQVAHRHAFHLSIVKHLIVAFKQTGETDKIFIFLNMKGVNEKKKQHTLKKREAPEWAGM